MTKQRCPGTFEHAVRKVSAHFGLDETGHLVGKSGALVQKWTDPDDDTLPNLRQALLLDTAMREATGHTPILDAYTGLVAAPRQERRGYLELIAHASKEISEAIAEFARARDDKSPVQAYQTLKEVDDAIEALSAFKDKLRSVAKPLQPVKDSA